jgi:hypothetical protein
MRDSVWRNLEQTARRIHDALVLVHLRWAVEGDRDPDGTPRQPRQGVFSWLVESPTGDPARILAGHNTNVRSIITSPE